MSHRSRLSGVRVLVVDDARYVLDVVTDMLQCNGANVTAVDSAEEALDILQRERPDVLLSDLSMPGCPARRLLVDRTGACAVAEIARHLGVSESGTASILRMLTFGAMNWSISWYDPKGRTPRQIADQLMTIVRRGAIAAPQIARAIKSRKPRKP